ncbi:hypothetical protein KJ611_04095 [Patescibacteria group bacterium]|nr:hypothetical protein [Patescibacteria group bacterium]MBU1705632.1 hypothetical protein [Patescibacteria group bacterium]
MSIFTRRPPRPAIFPDFSRLAQIRQDLTEIGIINQATTLAYLNRYLINPEVMAIPSIKRLFWVLYMGWEIRQPVIHFTGHYLGEDCLVYVAFNNAGREKHVIFADEMHGPYRFVKLDQEGSFFQFRIWRNRQMFLLWPDIRGLRLEEYSPEAF